MYRCHICDVGFKLKVHLKKHNLYRHNSDYPCQCRVCGKPFKDSSAVRLHERIHSTARPFQCACGKSFKTRENLWGHRHRRPCVGRYSAICLSSQTSSSQDALGDVSCLQPAPPPVTLTDNNMSGNNNSTFRDSRTVGDDAAAAAAVVDDDACARPVLRTECIALPAWWPSAPLRDVQRKTSSDRSRRPKMPV